MKRPCVKKTERKKLVKKQLMIASLLLLTGCAAQPPYELYKTQKDFETFQATQNENMKKIGQAFNQLTARVQKLEGAMPAAGPAQKTSAKPKAK